MLSKEFQNLSSLFERQQEVKRMREEMDWFLGVINGFLSKNKRGAPSEKYHFNEGVGTFLYYERDQIYFARGVIEYAAITTNDLPFHMVDQAYENFLTGVWYLLSKAGFTAAELKEFLKPFGRRMKTRVRCALRICLSQPTEGEAVAAFEREMLGMDVPVILAVIQFMPNGMAYADAAVLLGGQPEEIELCTRRNRD